MGDTHIEPAESGDQAHQPAEPPAPAPVVTGAAAAAASVQAEAMRQRWAVMGTDQRLTVAGGVAILVAYVIGLIAFDWNIGLSSILLLLETIVVLAVVVMGTSSILGMSRTAILRISAGVIGAFSLYDLGDLISGLTFWEPLDLVVSAVALIGAGALVIGVWRMTGGNFVTDVMGAFAARGRELPARLVSVGSAVLIAVWLILAVFNYAFRPEIALAVLAAVLALAVLWLTGSGAGEMKLPVAANLALAGLGAIAGALTALWFVGLLDQLDRVDAIDWPFLLIFLAAAAAMVAGGLLGMGARTAEPSA